MLAGQYVCVMAYGQTGAGKTHTMHGGKSELGVVQLAVGELLDEARALTSERALRGESLEVRFEASLLEIYNERVLDLNPLPEDKSAGGPKDLAAIPESLEVRAPPDGSVARRRPLSLAFSHLRSPTPTFVRLLTPPLTPSTCSHPLLR